MSVNETVESIREFLDHDTLIISALVFVTMYAMYSFGTPALDIAKMTISGLLGMAYGKGKTNAVNPPK